MGRRDDLHSLALILLCYLSLLTSFPWFMSFSIYSDQPLPSRSHLGFFLTWCLLGICEFNLQQSFGWMLDTLRLHSSPFPVPCLPSSPDSQRGSGLNPQILCNSYFYGQRQKLESKRRRRGRWLDSIRKKRK